MKSKMIARRKQAAPPVTPAAPAPPKPVAAPPPVPGVGAPPVPTAPQEYQSTDEALKAVSTDVLASMVKALVGGKEFANDKAAQFLIETMTAELKTRPVQVEDGEPRLASNKKKAGWISVNDKTMDLEEGGDRVPEIAEAHGKLEDHTGIVKTRVVLPEKLAAAEISTASAVKKAEGYVASLKNTYLESKVLSTVNGTRPVREAVESIYAASLRMADATKTLAKQQEQEEEESEKARKALETKKSSSKYKLGGLMVAAAEDDIKEDICKTCRKPQSACTCE